MLSGTRNYQWLESGSAFVNNGEISIWFYGYDRIKLTYGCKSTIIYLKPDYQHVSEEIHEVKKKKSTYFRKQTSYNKYDDVKYTSFYTFEKI